MAHTNQAIRFLLPVYNDFKSLEIVIKQIIVGANDSKFIKVYDFLVVDDCSSETDMSDFFKGMQKDNKLQIIRTKFRSGSQKAILLGLSYIAEAKSPHHLVVLDSDGEDMPKNAVLIAEKLLTDQSLHIIQATRGKRANDLQFIFFYFLYQFIFRILVGKKNPPGNFMGIANSQILNLLEYPSIDKHIASSILKHAPKILNLKFDRGQRVAGTSKMNYSNFFIHANGALSVFANEIFARIVFFIVFILLIISIIGFGILSLKIFGLSLFGWQPSLVGWTSLLLLIIFSSILIIGSNVILLFLLMIKIDK